MRKKLSILSIIFLLTLTNSCKSNGNNTDISENEIVEEQYDYLLDENYKNLKPLSELEPIGEDNLMYDEDVFGKFSGNKYQELYLNNKLDNSIYDGMVTDSDDAKYIFYNENKARLVNRTDGYAINMKSNTTVNGDFSLSKYRSKIYNKDFTLTITKEDKNPYSSWSLYSKECIYTHINNPNYLKQNDLSYSHETIYEKEDIKDGYLTSIFSIKINNPGNIKKCYYNIGLIKDSYDFKGKTFYLFVLKSNEDKYDDFVDMIKSFELIGSKGKGQNIYSNMETLPNPKWSEKTANYYNKLLTQQETNWGIFNYGISDDGSYDDILTMTENQLEKALDYELEILPAYQHLTTNGGLNNFPVSQANKHAGGDGFNGKKVLQFTYQYTNNNNNVSNGNTPIFDILRGPVNKDKLDTIFEKRDKIYHTLNNLANDIKSYDAPVLFRLNNEMNTDWTSYCAYLTLLDPDLFTASWRYLYNLFDQNDVDNCIFIFNPNAQSYPVSNWGEDMCFFPGNKYVQALGLTYYEANNDGYVNTLTFRKDYTYLYEKNNDVWQNYPWIISEFGCGAGGSSSGERFRNQQSQADYVKGMFLDFAHRDEHPYLQNIKGAVWFSANDYDDNGVSNQYELVISKLPLTMEAFKEGLALIKK